MVISHKPLDDLLKERGIEPHGKVQKYIDSSVIRYMSKYTPMDTGTLIKSATIHTVIGSGRIHQRTPYAHAQYYGNKGRGRQGVARGAGLRGKKWFERAMNAHGDKILDGAKKLSGAKR